MQQLGQFFQGTINLLILITVRLISGESVGPTILFIPILWWGYMQAVTSMCYLSVIGVIIKDVGQIIGSVVSIMMFLSPVFYPAEVVPPDIRWITNMNPLDM